MTNDTSPGTNAVVAAYRRIRSTVTSAERIAVLHLGADETGIAVGSSEAPEATLLLGIGSRKTATEYFKHAPPTPGELEVAIMIVEDEVARALKLMEGGAELFTSDASALELARAAGQQTGSKVVLSVECVERTFERLAAVSLGRPAASEGLPEGTEFAARLLIMRELMHHLGFSRITVLT